MFQVTFRVYYLMLQVHSNKFLSVDFLLSLHADAALC